MSNENELGTANGQSNGSDATDAPFDLDSALRASLRGGTAPIETHLRCLERDLEVNGTQTTLHCYFLPMDVNGNVRVKPLAEFLLEQIVDYAIPRETAEEAYQEVERSGSFAPISRLHERAKGLFTELGNSGEGGELLLFAMAEAVFGISQIICKMTLKTSGSMHYHGADGVYAEMGADGALNLYWGESKVYTDPSAAIRDCLASLAPFLREPEGADAQRHQDILLVNEFANFSDPSLVAGLKSFLDRDNPNSYNLRHCGFALSAFDSSSYEGETAGEITNALEDALRRQIRSWQNTTSRGIAREGLERFHIHFICVPLPSADAFRRYFLSLMGVPDDT